MSWAAVSIIIVSAVPLPWAAATKVVKISAVFCFNMTSDSNYYIVIDIIIPLDQIIYEWLDDTLVLWGENCFAWLVVEYICKLNIFTESFGSVDATFLQV